MACRCGVAAPDAGGGPPVPLHQPLDQRFHRLTGIERRGKLGTELVDFLNQIDGSGFDLAVLVALYFLRFVLHDDVLWEAFGP